eukprot:19921-Eustigmatos_ZCMA.PRE.1
MSPGAMLCARMAGGKDRPVQMDVGSNGYQVQPRRTPVKSTSADSLQAAQDAFVDAVCCSSKHNHG